ncbi:hypothetical protein [Bacillus pinisoli]|uniref:hypothetical protein n=1 Tax=Bacillus pinisoli TaxID=2901866 RepID=UPI001FF305C6|nr:hypothetical protein [Bacillus pinisoli]
MVGILLVLISLTVILLLQRKAIKKNKSERNKLVFFSLLTVASTLFLVLPYTPSVIMTYVNSILGSISKWVVTG